MPLGERKWTANLWGKMISLDLPVSWKRHQDAIWQYPKLLERCVMKMQIWKGECSGQVHGSGAQHPAFDFQLHCFLALMSAS